MSISNTSAILNMSSMFKGCVSLKEIDLSDFTLNDAVVTDDIFAGCSEVVASCSDDNVASFEDLGYVDTDNTVWFIAPSSFYGINEDIRLVLSDNYRAAINRATPVQYKNIPATEFAPFRMIENATTTDIDNLFEDCDAMTSIDLSGMDFTGIGSRSGLFKGCTSLLSINADNVVDSNTTSLMEMFYRCENVTSISMENWDTSSVTNIYGAFYCTYDLRSLNLESWNMTNCTAYSIAFRGSGVADLQVSTWNVAKGTSFTDMFTDASYLKTLDLSGWNISSTASTSTMFSGCTGVEVTCTDSNEASLDTAFGYGYDSTVVWTVAPSSFFTASVSGTVTTLALATNFKAALNLVVPTRYKGIAAGEVPALREVGTDYISLDSLFMDCGYITSLSLGHWDVSSVTIFQSICNNCSSLTSISGLENWDVSNVTNLQYAFYNCTSLTSISGLENWDVSSVTSIHGICNNCSSLTSISGLENWDISSLTNLQYAFCNCSSLTALDLSGWNNSQAISPQLAFYNCSSLRTLDVSDWTNFTLTLYYSSALTGCSNLEIITNDTQYSVWDTMISNSSLTQTEGGVWTTYPSAFFTTSTSDNVVTTVALNSSFKTALNQSPSAWYKGTSGGTVPALPEVSTTYMSLASMFSGCSNITALDLNHWDLTKVTTLIATFYNCSSLETVNCSLWDTPNLTNIQGTFYGCSSLTSLNIGGWTVDNVTTLYQAFGNCTSLTTLSISGWNVSNVTKLHQTFYNCSSLLNLDVSSWNTSKVTTLYQTFYGCSSVPTLAVSNWDVTALTEIASTFAGCSSITTLDLSKWVKSGSSIAIAGLLSGCSSLISADLSGITVSDLSAESMCDGCSSLTSLALPKGTIATSISSMFRNCASLTELDLTELTASSLTYSNLAFYNCTSLRKLDVSAWTIGSQNYASNIFTGCSNLAIITSDAYYTKWDPLITSSGLTQTEGGVWTEYPAAYYVLATSAIGYGDYRLALATNFAGALNSNVWYKGYKNTLPNYHLVTGTREMSNLFLGLSTMTSIDVSQLDADKAVGFYGVFSGCLALESITGLEKWKDQIGMRPSYDCQSLFYNCSSLTSISGLEDWDTSSVTYMNNTFYNCSSLTSLEPLANWNVSGLATLYYTFYGCSSLTSLSALENWNVSNVTNFSQAFCSCTNLTSLSGLEDWNVSSVTNLTNTFQYCSSLTSLEPLANWNVSSLITLNYVFQDCSSLTSLSGLENWNISSLASFQYAFSGCSSLVEADLSGWNNSQAASVTNTFYNCSSLRTLDVSGWTDFSPTGGYSSALTGCSNLEIITNDSKYSTWDTIISTSGLTQTEGGVWTTYPSAFYSLAVSDDITTISLNSFFKTALNQSTPAWYKGVSGGVMPALGEVTTTSISLAAMFSGMSAMGSLDVSAWDTSAVTAATNLFMNCSSLTSLTGLGNWDVSKITSFSYLFYYCSSLTSIPGIENWSTDALAYGTHIFYNCQSLTSLEGIKSWDISGVTGLRCVFYNCSSLTSLDLTGWNTSSVTDWAYAFYGFQSCEIDFTEFTFLSNATTDSMFDNCSGCYGECSDENLASFTALGYDSSMITFYTGVLYYAASVTGTGDDMVTTYSLSPAYSAALAANEAYGELDAGEVASLPEIESGTISLDGLFANSDLNVDTLTFPEGYVTSDVTNIDNMFSGCSGSVVITEDWDMSNVTSAVDTFADCTDFEIICTDDQGTLLDASIAASNIEQTVGGVWTIYPAAVYSTSVGTSSTTISLSDLMSTAVKTSGYFKGRNVAVSCIMPALPEVTTSEISLESMFYSAVLLTSLDVSAWTSSMSSVTTLRYTFRGCSSLTSISGLENWDVSSVTSLYYTFYDCSSLTSISGLENWDVSSVTSLRYTFYNCTSLTSISALANWDVSSVPSLEATFCNCRSLTSLSGLEDWDVSSVTSFLTTFYQCSSLTSLSALADWDVSSATTLKSTFYSCSSLTSLEPLADWEVSSATTLEYTFSGCSGLTSLTSLEPLADWDVSNVINLQYTFRECSGLTSISALANWNVSSVTNLYGTFYNCSRLTSINLTSWNVGSVSSASSTFYGLGRSASATTLDISTWTLPSCSTFNMFLSYTLSTLTVRISQTLYDKLSAASALGSATYVIV